MNDDCNKGGHSNRHVNEANRANEGTEPKLLDRGQAWRAIQSGGLEPYRDAPEPEPLTLEDQLEIASEDGQLVGAFMQGLHLRSEGLAQSQPSLFHALVYGWAAQNGLVLPDLPFPTLTSERPA